MIASAGAGLDWLSGQNNADGSIALPTDIGSPYQSTAQALWTYQSLGAQPPAGNSGVAGFINSESFHSTEYFSLKIIINAKAGSDVTELVAEPTLL